MRKESSQDDHKMFEESILLVRAPSVELANVFGEQEAKKQRHDYFNTYGEKVEWKFVELIDCVCLSAQKLQIGAEVYARFLIVPPDIVTKEVISYYYPETVRDELVDKNFLLKNKGFKARPNSTLRMCGFSRMAKILQPEKCTS